MAMPAVDDDIDNKHDVDNYEKDADTDGLTIWWLLWMLDNLKFNQKWSFAATRSNPKWIFSSTSFFCLRSFPSKHCDGLQQAIKIHNWCLPIVHISPYNRYETEISLSLHQVDLLALRFFLIRYANAYPILTLFKSMYIFFRRYFFASYSDFIVPLF